MTNYFVVVRAPWDETGLFGPFATRESATDHLLAHGWRHDPDVSFSCDDADGDTWEARIAEAEPAEGNLCWDMPV